MIRAITILLLFQLAGEIVVVALKIPIPGPVMGMLFLLASLMIRGSTPPPLQNVAQFILKHLSLLYIPAGVGVMVHFSRLQSEGVAILITLIASTIITIVTTAYIMQFLISITRRKSGDAA